MMTESIRQNSNFNTTEFHCKQCGVLVWIKNDTEEDIKNEITDKEFSKDYGLCRWCFVNLRNRVGE